MARYLPAKVDRRYWSEEIKAATYLKNRTLANTFITKTLYEILFNRKPSVNELKLYGSRRSEKIKEG